MTTLLIILFAVMLLIDLPRIIKQKQTRMLLIYGCFFVAAFVFSLLYNLGVKITSPMVLADNFFKQVMHLSY